MKLVYEYEQIHCTLMMAKVRITPKRFVSISRLELFAAFLAVICLDQKRFRGGQFEGIFLDR